MFADIQLCVTTPEPTSILDFYRFLKLATIRKALNSFLSHDQVSKALKQHNFQTLDDIFLLAEKTKEGAREKAQLALNTFHPLLIINKAGNDGGLNKLRLRKVAAKFLGINMPDLGEIPYDRITQEAVNSYLPICEFAPNSPPSKALFTITANLISLIDRFSSQKTAKTII
jgi:flagellar biosynthesis protein FlhG